MPHTADKRYVVVSCHVERPLDDKCWRLFSALQERAPGGLRVAALMRPADEEAGEDGEVWLARAREAAERGPLGQHTHFVGPQHARPSRPGPEHAERMRREAAQFREAGLEPGFFCGGGWYMDEALAAALADLGYADCTATAFRPRHLGDSAPRLSLAEPAWLLLPGGRRLLELPATHSLGMAARASLDPAPLPDVVHVYFHDTDLLSPVRRAALEAALRVLARRRRPADLEQLSAEVAAEAREVPFSEVASAP